VVLADTWKIIAIGFGAAILLGPAFADSPRQFDLICTDEVAPFTAFPTSSHMSDDTGPELEPPPAPK
jgi:hypothetical protein